MVPVKKKARAWNNLPREKRAAAPMDVILLLIAPKPSEITTLSLKDLNQKHRAEGELLMYLSQDCTPKVKQDTLDTLLPFTDVISVSLSLAKN
jgi:hypothetical protein